MLAMGTTLTMTDVDKTAFGASLKRYRQAAGLTGAALAARLSAHLGEHVVAQSVSGWERGHNLPARHKVEALEHVLAVPDHHLLDLAGYWIGPARDDRIAELEAMVVELTKKLRDVAGRLDDVERRRRGTGGGRGGEQNSR